MTNTTNNTDYDYMEAMTEDIREYIKNEVTLSDYSNREELEEYLHDTLWTEDSVTGNASGSYTFNTYRAEEYICHNLDLLKEAIEEFGYTENVLEKGAEWCDVTIRCYLLGQAIAEVLDNMEEELEEAFAETEEVETKKYKTHEEPYEGQTFTESEMHDIYNTTVNHNPDECGWATYEDWLHDMLKSGAFAEAEEVEV